MTKQNTINVLTTALQIAIVAARSGQTVEEAKKNARTKLWESYTPESQAAAERGIENYFNKVTKAVPPVVAGPVLVTEQTLATALTELRPTSTKEDMLAIARDFGVKVAKSWTKAKILEALTAAPQNLKLAA